jgi:predicted nucleic acid-binding protein
MTGQRLLLDTVFIQALLNKRDAYHKRALSFLPRVREASEVWITEAVLLEVGNALGGINRQFAAEFTGFQALLTEES